MWMHSKGLGTSARKLVAAFPTIRSIDVTVPVPTSLCSWFTSVFTCQKVPNSCKMQWSAERSDISQVA
jgi:hypothetical protein